jgi:glycosyltransferase involved in cell wall biosynthesis
MALAYDITRLALRLFNVTPNGIDRVDFALAAHFLGAGGSDRHGVLAAGFRPQLLPADAARGALEAIALHWGEAENVEDDPGYIQTVECLSGRKPPQYVPRISQGRSGRLAAAMKWLSHYGMPIGRSPKRHLECGARYLNVSQFPLWFSGYFEWLEERSDVKAIFLIHDLLPIEMPGYFRSGEFQRHRHRLANVARFGAAILVTSEVVRADVASYMCRLGRGDIPIMKAAIPCAPLFSNPRFHEPKLAGIAYFVCCGTLEPRKNHITLLKVWNELFRSLGEATPKLVLVGVRGWKYGPVLDLLERNPMLRGLVIEVAGLTSAALKRLLDSACALLMPSLAEGYGLPVHEALGAGVPVIASDIPVFREIASDRLLLLDPLDEQAWFSAIRQLAARGCEREVSQSANSDNAADWAAYFKKIDEFVAAI